MSNIQFYVATHRPGVFEYRANPCSSQSLLLSGFYREWREQAIKNIATIAGMHPKIVLGSYTAGITYVTVDLYGHNGVFATTIGITEGATSLSNVFGDDMSFEVPSFACALDFAKHLKLVTSGEIQFPGDVGIQHEQAI